jgi:hypothetical protein
MIWGYGRRRSRQTALDWDAQDVRWDTQDALKHSGNIVDKPEVYFPVNIQEEAKNRRVQQRIT